MKRAARENKLRENKQQRTERLYSAASKVSQLGLRLDSNPFQIEFLPKFNLLRLALIQAGCLGKRPTGEVNTAGLGVWWVGEAENKVRGTCKVSDGRLFKVWLAESRQSVQGWSHFYHVERAHLIAQMKKGDIFNELTSWRKRKHARTAVLVIQVMAPSSQQGGAAPRATRETNSYLLRLASCHCFSPRSVALADPELTISTGPPSKPDTMHGKDSSRCFVNKWSSRWNTSALLDTLIANQQRFIWSFLLPFGKNKQLKM